jgi:hypothetical protein
MKLLVSTLFLFSIHCLFAQWKESSINEYIQILQKSEAVIPKNASVSYDCNYRFFNTFDSPVPSSEEIGFFESVQGKSFYVNQMGLEMVQSDKLCIVIDTLSKLISLKDPDTTLMSPKPLEMIELFKTSAISVQKMETGKQIKFSFQFVKGAKFAGAEIWFNQNYLVEKYILFSATEVYNNPDFLGQGEVFLPKLEIVFSNYNLNRKSTSPKFKKPEDFVILVNGSYELKDKTSETELIDLRNKKQAQ